uniref:G-protein coupled receptors family 1 profile domain-containing protein n=1 Tax=Anopheles albimanus TaxID=7167 RepID=A0A182F760_ANOAL
MFIIVVTIFAICWLPYHLFFVYAYHNNQMTSSSYVQQLYLGFYWLAMSNAMVNPIIYYWMNGRFRVYFQEIICFCCLQFINSRMPDGVQQGVLLNKNSNSELGRYRSYRQRSVSVRWRPPSTEEYRMRTGLPRPAHLSVNVIENATSNGDKQGPGAVGSCVAATATGDMAELQSINFLHLNHNSTELKHSSSNSHEFS